MSKNFGFCHIITISVAIAAVGVGATEAAKALVRAVQFKHSKEKQRG